MIRSVRSKEIMSSEQLAEIGSLALESTDCEVMVESLIWDLAGMDPDSGKLFTHGMQMNTRLETLSSLGKARLSSDDQLEKFAAIISTLKDLNSKRNMVIHGIWGAWMTLREIALSPQSKPTPKAFKRRPNKSPLELSAADLHGMPEAIARATAALRGFAEKAWPPL